MSEPLKAAMIAGQSPSIKWKLNSGGIVRTIREACEIAGRWGIVIPDYVHFAVDRFGWLDTETTARTTMFRESPGTMIYWSCFFHKKTGKIPFLIRKDILESDEAIVAVIGHEIFELEALREAFGDGAPIEYWEAETSPDNPGNFHCDAWDYADKLVASMRKLQ